MNSLGRAGRTRPTNELAQNSQVASIEVFPVYDTLGWFQDHRKIPEAGIVDQMPKRFEPHLPRPDRRVTVDAAAAFTAAVVPMPDSQGSPHNGTGEPGARF